MAMVRGIERRIRHAVERVLVLRRIDEDVEEILADLGIRAHEGQVAVDHADDRAGSPRLAHAARDIEREVGIAAQAVAPAALRDHHRHRVQAARQHVAARMGVVAADVVGLGRGRAQHRAGAEVELVELDMGRHPAGSQVLQVVQVRHARERPARKGLHEAPFEPGGPAGDFQRERGAQVQAQARIGLGAGVEGVQERNGLAEAQGRATDDPGAGAGEEGIEGGFEVGRAQRGQRKLLQGETQVASGGPTPV